MNLSLSGDGARTGMHLSVLNESENEKIEFSFLIGYFNFFYLHFCLFTILWSERGEQH